MAESLVFQSTTFHAVTQNNKPWLTMRELAGALYGATKGGGQSDATLENAEKSLRRLYTRNASEFTTKMTALIKVPTAGGMQEVRVFSLRGAHLLAMFARTTVAAEFRKWVLDILDGHGEAAPVDYSRALAAANEVAAQMQAAVFDAILNGNSNWKLQRAMVSFNVGRDGALTPRVDLIEHEAIVMTLPHLAKAIAEPGGMLPSNPELANLAAACNKRLAQRLEFAGSRDALNNG